jgi:ketosteroid isomerase-like protein
VTSAGNASPLADGARRIFLVVERREAARRWARTWERAWAAHDVPAIAGLYAPDASFRSHPFRPVEPAQAYVERVFAEEASAEPHFDDPVVDGDQVVVAWRSRVRLRNGQGEDLVGVSLLRFDADGLVRDQRDIWCQKKDDGAIKIVLEP